MENNNISAWRWWATNSQENWVQQQNCHSTMLGEGILGGVIPSAIAVTLWAVIRLVQICRARNNRKRRRMEIKCDAVDEAVQSV